MQVATQKPSRRSPEIPARPPAAEAITAVNRVCRRNHGLGSSGSRSRLTCTCSSRPGSTRCAKHGYVVPSSEKLMRRNNGSKEILRRALAPPPNRRMSLSWWNFKPTPSRLSSMSMA